MKGEEVVEMGGRDGRKETKEGGRKMVKRSVKKGSISILFLSPLPVIITLTDSSWLGYPCSCQLCCSQMLCGTVCSLPHTGTCPDQDKNLGDTSLDKCIYMCWGLG